MLTRAVAKDILMQNLSIRKLDDRYSIIDGVDEAVEAILRADTSRGLSLPQPPNIICTHCHSGYALKAHHTGDGWALWWECTCGGETTDIAWPFGDGWVGRDTLERAGFGIV